MIINSICNNQYYKSIKYTLLSYKMDLKEGLDQLNQSCRIGKNIKYARLTILVSLIFGISFFYGAHKDDCNLIFLTELGKITTLVYFLLVCIENFMI